MVPIVARSHPVNLASALRHAINLPSPRRMDTAPLEQALDRAERALLRIERSVQRGAMHRGKDDALRGKVSRALADLDTLLRESAD